MANKIIEDLVNLYESLLRSQLNTLKQFRKDAGYIEQEKPVERRMSHMDMVYNILKRTEQTMHVNDIIIAIEKNFGIKVDRDSLVSALAKRVARQDRFIKTAPNTFALISQELGGVER